MTYNEIISWLLSGDVSIQYQTQKDLVNADDITQKKYKACIAKEGFGQRFMACQHQNGHWGERFYQPKWKSTHYTLLDLTTAYQSILRTNDSTYNHTVQYWETISA